MHDHHDHDHGGHSHGPARHARPLWISLGIISAFFVVEVVGAILTNSLALLADAGHMLSDVAGLGLSLFAVWIASRPATPQRTYGYHRVEVLAAGFNALALLGISVYITWEAFQRLGNPPEIASGPMLVVAFAGLVANLATAFVLSKSAGESINMRGAFLHVIGDTLGAVGAMAAAVVMLTTGWYYADPIISFVISLLIVFSGGRLLKETLDILMEGAPDHIDLADVEKELRALPGVAGVHDLHVWTVTSGFPAMSAHLKLCDSEDRRVLGLATGLLRERFGVSHSTIQTEAPGDVDGLHDACVNDPIGCGCIGTTVAPCVPSHANH